MPGWEKELIRIVQDKEERLYEVKRFVKKGVKLSYYEGSWDVFHNAVRSGHVNIINYFLEIFKSYIFDKPSQYEPIQVIVSSKMHQSLKWAPTIEVVELIAPYLITEGDYKAEYEYALSWKSESIRQFLNNLHHENKR